MQANKKRVRMGMVGGGEGAFIGAVHRIAAALDQEIELVAGCFSRDPENTRRTGAALGLDAARCYPDYQALFAGEAALPAEERMEFVSVVTPNNSHYPIAAAALDRGFHVLCDKPLVVSLAEARALEKKVEETGLLFCVSYNYSGNAMVKEARHLIRSGALGPIRKVMVEYLQEFLSYPYEKEGNKQALWRVDPGQAGLGGTLGDCGSHALHLLEYLIGEEVAELSADKAVYMPGRVLDEDVNLLLRLKGGGKGTMTVSQIAVGHENDLSIRVYGAHGSIQWRQEDPNYLVHCEFGKPKKTLSRGNAYCSADAAGVTRIPTGHPEGYLEAFATVYRAFAVAVAQRRAGALPATEGPDYPGIGAGVRGVLFIAKAIESAQNNGAWTALV